MNKSKVIILVAAAAVAVAVGVVIMLSGLDKQKAISLPKNQFTVKIEQEIEQLKAKPDNKFCKDFYKEVASHIKTFYDPKKFGEKILVDGSKTYDSLANDQWKENLDKTLYRMPKSLSSRQKLCFAARRGIPTT